MLPEITTARRTSSSRRMQDVAPQNSRTAQDVPAIGQAMVYGDKRKYLTVLVALPRRAREAARRKGISPGSYAQMAARPENAEAAVQAIIDQINAEQPPYTRSRSSTDGSRFSQEAES